MRIKITMKRIGVSVVACLLLLLQFQCRIVMGFSITVNELECVYENVQYEGDTVSGNFVVVDHEIFWSSDHPGVDLVVTAPAGNVVYNLKGTSGDKFQFKAPRSGMYKFCFHSSYSAPETISFYIHVGHIPREHDLAKEEHLDPINVRIAELREALDSVSAEQRYLRARDARHRHRTLPLGSGCARCPLKDGSEGTTSISHHCRHKTGELHYNMGMSPISRIPQEHSAIPRDVGTSFVAVSAFKEKTRSLQKFLKSYINIKGCSSSSIPNLQTLFLFHLQQRNG